MSADLSPGNPAITLIPIGDADFCALAALINGGTILQKELGFEQPVDPEYLNRSMNIWAREHRARLFIIYSDEFLVGL